MRQALLAAGLLIAITSSVEAQSEPSRPAATLLLSEQARLAADLLSDSPNDAPDQSAQASREKHSPRQLPARKRTRLQLGAALKSTVTPGVDSADSLGPNLIWRWRGRGSRVDDSWAPAYRLSSFSSRVSSPLAGNDLPVGDVKVRPLMLGVDYKMPRGNWNWAAGLSAGWAVNNINTPSQYRTRAIRAAGATDLWVDVHNSFVWGPRLKGWYDLNPRVSFLVESSYLVTRPMLDVHAHGVLSSRRLNADALVLKAGIVYGIF